VEEEKKEGAILFILYFITVIPAVNINYFSYKDIL